MQYLVNPLSYPSSERKNADQEESPSGALPITDLSRMEFRILPSVAPGFVISLYIILLVSKGLDNNLFHLFSLTQWLEATHTLLQTVT